MKQKHPYSDYIAEIERGWKKTLSAESEIALDLKKVLFENILNSDLDKSQSDIFFEFLIDKLGLIYGGPHKLCSDEEQEYFRKSYRNVFNNLTTHGVITGLYEIASGNTEYKRFPPNALEFQDICRKAPKIPDYSDDGKLKIEGKVSSKEESLKNVGILKKMLLVKSSSQIEFIKNKASENDSNK